MNWLTSTRTTFVLGGFSALTYLAWRIWQRKRNSAAEDNGIDFRPKIGFTRLDGWASLAVLLDNKSESNVWTEEIEIVLTGLLANDQTSEPSFRETQKIRQTIRPHDMLPVSLVETIYLAAGKPQRKYSCVMSSIVRYRVGEEWFEKQMHPYSLKMAGLTVASNHREPWAKSAFKPQGNPQEEQTVGSKSK